jgi:hypothetical protein
MHTHFTAYVFLILLLNVSCSPSDDLTTALKALKTERILKGMQLQVTKSKDIVYNINLG